MKYVLVFGLILVSMAIVMLFLGNNTQAVVIVDQAGGGDYLTIQEGVDNAVPGETVYVWDGTYNENITIDKNLQLIGNGSATTIIDASGLGNNIVNITAEGVQISGFNITNNQTYYGIWANVGGFSIHDNIFYNQNLVNWAIYMDVNRLNPGSTTVGDIIVDNNEVIGTHGFYFNIWFEEPLSASDLIFGDTVISHNTLYNTQTGIQIDRYTVFSMDQGTITWGDILVKDNYVNSSGSEGIFFWGIFWNMTDVNIDLGKMDISGNNITSQSNGIYIDWWDICDGIYGNTIATTQDTHVYNNDIVSQSARGLLLQTDVIGDKIYDSTSITTGSFFIFSNNITTISGPASAGIYWDMSEIASEMYNDSSVNFGNIYVDSNFIISTGSSIDFLIDECGAYMYDNAQAWFGNFHVTNNNVTSTGDGGIDFRWYQVGYNQYDNSRVMMGEVHVEDNDVVMTGGVGFALEVRLDTVCTQMYGDSFLSLDDWYVEGNTVTSSERGIQAGRQTSFYEMYDNSWVVYHDFYVRDNVVDSDQLCMYIDNYECCNYMEDFSRVVGGNRSVTGNNVSSQNGYGIQVDYHENGRYNYDQSHAIIGWFDISYNNFSSDNNYGGYVDIHELGAYLYGNSQVYIGDVTIENNEFWAPSMHGLYLYQFYQNAFEMYDSSYVLIGDILVNDNNIISGGYGIYMEEWIENAYNMFQYASAYFGNFEFNRNIIEATGDGINVNNCQYWVNYLFFDNHVTMGHWQFNDNQINSTGGDGLYINYWAEIGSYMYGSSTFSMGNFDVLRNTINSNDDGIYASIYDLAYDLYGGSQCYFGNFLFNENTINASGDGIYFSEIDYLACNMYGSSYAEFGNFEVNNNDIMAGYGSALGYDGIYCYFYKNGYNMQGNSEAHFGHLQINDNTITCHDEDGIYFWYFYEIASEMYDNSYFEMGNVEMCRNWVDAGGIGIYLEYLQYLGYTNYDNSQAYFGDFLFNENNITSGSHGILGEYLYYWGYELYGESDAYFGNVEFNNNTVNATGYGIILGDTSSFSYGFQNWGCYLYSSNEVILGHVQINDNDILARNGDGIQVYYFYEIGYEMYMNSYFSMENFEICRNTINASEDGIEMYEIDELAHAIYDNSEAHFRDFLFNDNDIIAGAYGFYNYYIEYLANDMFDNSRAEFGNFEFNRNTILAGDDGMYFYESWYENGYNMHDSSMAECGHYQINDNFITSTGGDGIYFYEFYEIGYYMLEDAYFEMGNFEICRNVINAMGYGIYVEEFEYVAYYMGYDGGTEYPGLTTFIMGDILFNDNVIMSGLEGITLYYFSYLANEMYGNAYAQFGNFEINRNHITSSAGAGIYIYDLYEWAYTLYDSSEVVFGHIQVNDNNITAGNETLAYDGIYLWEWFDPGSDMNDLSMLTIGNFEMCRNVIKAGDDGIDIGDIEGLAYFNYDSSVCQFGDLLWNDNVITAGLKIGDGYGITIDAIKFIGYQLDDQSDAYYGNIEFNRNVIHSWDDGIHVYNEYWGHLLYGGNEVIFGHFQINDNTINATNGRGIDMNYFNEIGFGMEGTSTFWMDNLEICRNNIIAGNETYTGNNGIYMEIQKLAYDNEDSAWCHFGDFLFNDNVIVASQYGIYIAYIEYLAAYLADSNPAGSCYAEFGNFEFNRNTITSLDDGIYVSDWAYWGYDLYHESEAHFGHIQFNDNWILAGNDTLSSDGMYFGEGPIYDFAYSMYGNSYASFENTEICRNTINCTYYGMDIYSFSYIGYEMYGNSRAEFQDFLVNENDIISGYTGLYIYYFYYVGTNMYDESSFIMGDFQLNGNVIAAGLGGSGDGIYLEDWGYNGYEMYANTYAEFGSFEVCRNWVDPPGYGIYIYPYQWGANLYGQSVFMMGDWLINNNTVVSAGDVGIYFNSDAFGYENYDFSRAYFGKNEIMYNTVNSTTGDGIEAWWWYEFGAYLYDYAYVEVGGCHIMYNDVISWSPSDYGIYTGPNVAGRWVYDDSQAYFGEYVVSDNNIFSNSSDGIYFYYYQMGYWLDSFNLPETRAIVEFGETRLNDNTINAPDGLGIYFDGQDVGEETHDYSRVTTGDIQINRNQIYSNDTSLYMGILYFGYDNDHYSQVRLGTFYVNDNKITSYNDTGIEIYIYESLLGDNADCDVYVGDIYLTNNEIHAGWIGIDYLIESSIEVNDNSVVHFPGLYVINNRVDPDISAFNYTAELTPVNVDPTTTLTIGDVVLRDNYFDGGLFGAAFDWLTPSSIMPDFYLINNDIVMGSANSTGLHMKNIESAYIENLLIDGYDQGIYVNNSNIWLMFNSTISNILSYHMNLTSASFIGAVNCTFNKAAVYYEDDVSELKVGWFMNVLVITQAGYGVPGAHVVIGDVYGTITFDGNANTLGQAFYRIAWEYLENITGIIDTYNNHTADADKDSVFGFAIPDPLMDQTKLVIIILGDSVPPNVFGDTSDTFGTTGDPFNFGIDANDNFGIYSVHVTYRFIGAGPGTNVTMTGTGPFTLIINIPSSFVGTMRYYFSVQDVGGYWVQTGFVDVPITDNDAPTINSDNSDTSATTGDIFNFIVDATDNVDVTETHVVWWFDANPQNDDVMNGAGPYDFNVTVPSGSLDDLHYYFRVRDAAGNWFIGTQVNVTVTDNDAPTINTDNSDTAATTGEQFYFDVDITDNMGMNQTNLVYWFGIDTPITVPMNGTWPYTYNISVPSDSLEMLHYYFTASDIYGNWLFGPLVNVTVTDNDTPTGLVDTSDTSATTGDSFSFEVNATDNIGISDVYAIYWFGTGNLTNTSMTGTGPYNFGITIPADSLDTLHYYFAMTDANGNWLVGSQVDVFVIDNDAPVVTSDDSDTSATAGKSFTFQVNATDNIGVTKVYVIYWFDSEPDANATMKGTGPFNRTVIIAVDASMLHYYFAARDAAGNWALGDQVDVSIAGAILPDDIPPTLDSDDSDTEATTGDSFEFDVTFNDNIGVTEIHVVYWFDAETPVDTVILGTYTITVPSDSLDTLHYYFTAKDAAGNEYVGTQADVDVTDNDPPYNLLDDSDTTAATGGSFTFNGDADDNIGVTSAEVVYWFDSGAQTTAAMTGSDPFTNSVNIPSTAGVLHYYLVFDDAEGNSARTKQKDITIADNEPGTLSNDASDTSGRQGQSFRFQVDASDNIGVTQVYAAYWFGDDESKKVLLPLTGAAGTYSGSFVPSEHGTLHYYFLVIDSQGNEFEGEEKTATIEAAEISPGEKEGEQEASIFPWILVVILIIVIVLLLLLLLRKKGEEPEALPAEPGEGGGVEGELGEEGFAGETGGVYEERLDEEPGEELEEEPDEGPEEGTAIPEEEEGLEGLEEEVEPETGEEPGEDIAGEEEVAEVEPEVVPKEEATRKRAATGEITCPNCGIASSADTEECPICRTKLQ